MRLWHYSLIPYLPKSQLIAQWRELNSIFKNQPKHILINYIYDYQKDDLFSYTVMVNLELMKRKINIKSYDNVNNYFGKICYEFIEEPFKNHHNKRYLFQCFYNLEEKFDRGQKDFTQEEYDKLNYFIREELYNKCI